jgi:hypothetical protein
VACAAGAGCLSGCVNPFAPAGGSGVQPGTPIQQQQRAVDAAKERYGLAMDVLTPLVERGVIADADVLRIIRVSVKQIDAGPEGRSGPLVRRPTADGRVPDGPDSRCRRDPGKNPRPEQGGGQVNSRVIDDILAGIELVEGLLSHLTAAKQVAEQAET